LKAAILSLIRCTIDGLYNWEFPDTPEKTMA